MPRPTTKAALLAAAQENFAKMWQMIDTLSDEAQRADFQFGEDPKRKEAHWKRDRNLRDVLMHLYEWHQLLLGWVAANQNSVETPFLPPPYNWKTYGDMNVAFWQKHQDTPYDAARDMLRQSHAQALALLEGFSDEELFTKGALAWTGGATLGSYGVSATASHYDWAMKKIKLHRKTLGDAG